MDTPYKFYDGKLGFKVNHLTTDRCHEDSLKLISYRSIYNRMKSKTQCEKELRRASLGNPALVLFSSLSREWKDSITVKWGEPEKEATKSWFAQHYVADRKAFDFFVAHRYGDNNEKKLDLKLVEQYTYNASVLNTVLKVKEARKSQLKARRVVGVDIWQSLSNDVNAFREVEHNLPTTKGGLRRKVGAFQKNSYASLISGRLTNSNATKIGKKEQMAVLDELIAHPNNLSNELIKDAYNSMAKTMGWKTITAGTVANRKEKKELISHAGRKGIKSLQNTKLMQVKRSKPSTPMLYWTVDGWDAELYYQDTKVDKKGHSVTTYTNRLTIVVVLDAHNNYPVGYAIGTHETPQLIQQAFQNSMNHIKELFGDYYRPYQLQTDNYAKKALTPLYNMMTDHFTPAQVGNAKSKIIEPYFNRLNKKYCQLLNNWSGFGVASGSKRQPNVEVLNNKKKDFPDMQGCIAQLENIMATERSINYEAYSTKWLSTKEEHKTIMNAESYLLSFGSNTGHTYKLRGEGLGVTINGEKVWFDSFDVNFRLQAHQEWIVQYDENNLDNALAMSVDGSERFMLEQKYIQPMAIADQTEEDIVELKRIKDKNKTIIATIIEERTESAQLANPFLERPQLEGTLAKHLLTDSLGQHKNNKSAERLEANKQATKILVKEEKKETKRKAKTFADERLEYLENKVNTNEYFSL